MRRVSRAILGLLVSILLVGAAGSAHADCALDERPLDVQLAEAPVVFVGRVVDLRHATTARMAVDEVWQGSVPAEVTVLGGPDEAGVATSVDRTWEAGATYLVLPDVREGRLHDSSCTSTRPWTDDLAAFRPATAHAPTPVEDGGTGLDAWAVVLVGTLLVASVTVVAVFARPGGREVG